LLRREPEAEVLPACERLGIGFLPYFPLFSGLLTGKYRRGRPLPTGTRIVGNARWEAHLTEANYDLIERLSDYSEGHGMELLDLAFAWLLAKPQVTSVIAGATNPAQVARNAKAGSFGLSSAQLAEVNALLDA
ncbi:MAG TPA: aldo/keto reductase, partial [Trueperaceae bacterium]|nr:aldo/keto reductase [Trueperaceae bacterium]